MCCVCVWGGGNTQMSGSWRSWALWSYCLSICTVGSWWFESDHYLSGSESVSLSGVSDSFRPHRPQPARLLCSWNSPGKNTGMCSHSLLQGIFLTQESNPGLLHSLRHQGNFFSWSRRSLLQDTLAENDEMTVFDNEVAPYASSLT